MTYLDITHLQAHIEQLTNENERLSSEVRVMDIALKHIASMTEPTYGLYNAVETAEKAIDSVSEGLTND